MTRTKNGLSNEIFKNKQILYLHKYIISDYKEKLSFTENRLIRRKSYIVNCNSILLMIKQELC